MLTCLSVCLHFQYLLKEQLHWNWMSKPGTSQASLGKLLEKMEPTAHWKKDLHCFTNYAALEVISDITCYITLTSSPSPICDLSIMYTLWRKYKCYFFYILSGLHLPRYFHSRCLLSAPYENIFDQGKTSILYSVFPQTEPTFQKQELKMYSLYSKGKNSGALYKLYATLEPSH